jgi:peptidoglycan/xylan/chitin deacetylase (PgdA/CDA1 family)
MRGGGSLVVMYHYVWPDGAAAPGGIRPLMASEFERQLDWLGERFDVVGAGEFLESLKARGRSRPTCLLTFDDGTRDHAEVVAPILARRGLSGVFFVLTWPVELGRMPLTHAVHWLLGQGEEAVWEALERGAIAETGSVAVLGEASEAERIYHYETRLRARTKYAVNMAMPHALAERIVERGIRSAGASAAELAGRWFVSARQVREMHDAGMTIGLHGCSHRSLQVLGAQGIGEELSHCSRYVSGLIGARPTWFACPFGGTGAPVEAVAAMHAGMRACWIEGSVTTEKALVPEGCDAWRLPRIDAADLPPRRSVEWAQWRRL